MWGFRPNMAEHADHAWQSHESYVPWSCSPCNDTIRHADFGLLEAVIHRWDSRKDWKRVLKFLSPIPRTGAWRVRDLF